MPTDARRNYRLVGDVAFGMVMQTLREGEDKYPDTSLPAMIGPQRTDHLPHAVEHAAKAYLQAGHTVAQLLLLIGRAMLTVADEAVEDHIAHAVTRLTQEAMREEGVEAYTRAMDE